MYGLDLQAIAEAPAHSLWYFSVLGLARNVHGP